LDSREFIQRLDVPRQARTFFYLDAHWEESLPPREELDLIIREFKQFVVMIDDFEIPNDPGYGFDDYGPGKRLSLRDLSFIVTTELHVTFLRGLRFKNRDIGEVQSFWRVVA